MGETTTICPTVTSIDAAPLETSLGAEVQLAGFVTSNEGAHYAWTGNGGQLAAPEADVTTFQCGEAGDHPLSFSVSKPGCPESAMEVTVTCTDTGAGAGVGGASGSGG